MADAATTTEATTSGTTTTAAATTNVAWYDGKAGADIVGHWQNKLTADVLGDPVKVALEMTKRHLEAEKFVGAPADQIIRLPKDAKDEAGWKSVYQRLGVPKEAKEYDFTAVKRADGNAIDPALSDAIRASAFTNNVTKDAAVAFAADVVKQLDAAEASRTAELTSKLSLEKAELARNWGPNADFNKLTAMQGAKRLGVTPEEVANLEKSLGYAKVMEMFRKVGAGTSEDTFIEGKNTNPTTMESAQARMNELINDKAWGERLVKGDAAAKREFDALTRQITGVSEAA